MQEFKVGDIIIPIILERWTSEFSDNSPIDICKNKPVKILKIGETQIQWGNYTPMLCVDIKTGIEYGFSLSYENRYELYTGKIPKKVDIINFDGGF